MCTSHGPKLRVATLVTIHRVLWSLAMPWLRLQPSHGQRIPLVVREVPLQYPWAHKAAQGGDALRSSCLAQWIAALQRLEEGVPEEVHVSLEHLLYTNTVQLINNSATEMRTSHIQVKNPCSPNIPDLRPAPSLQGKASCAVGI